MKILENLEMAVEDVEPFFDLQFIDDSYRLKFGNVILAIQAYFSADETRKFDPSLYFSRQLYRALHPDARWSQQDPLEHYLKTGRFEGRSPHPLFHVRLVHEQNQQIPIKDIYRAFLGGNTEGPFHELIHVAYVTAQSPTLNTPIRIFAEFANPSVPLRLSPHPLFDAELYRSFAAGPPIANELIDFLLHPAGCLVTSPFFDPVYYAQTARLGQLEVPPLLHYLRNWHVWRGDVSLFVDIKFLNHQISRALAGGNAESFGEPLTFALTHHLGVQNPFLHPQNHPGAVERAFPNLLVKDAAHKVPEAVQAASVFRHFLLDRPKPAVAPLVSVVILNYYKPVYTCLSIFSVLNAFPDNDVEIIVVENGGELSHFEIMKRHFSKLSNVSFIKMRVNKFFGEGNNVAVDQPQKGKYVLFLNNDCFLACDYGSKFKELIRAHPDVDAVGALMLFPDGAIQEYGGFVSDCGQVIQRAKGLPVGHLAPHLPSRNRRLCVGGVPAGLAQGAGGGRRFRSCLRAVLLRRYRFLPAPAASGVDRARQSQDDRDAYRERDEPRDPRRSQVLFDGSGASGAVRAALAEEPRRRGLSAASLSGGEPGAIRAAQRAEAARRRSSTRRSICAPAAASATSCPRRAP